MIEAIADNNIEIPMPIPVQLFNALKDRLQWPNPDFIKRTEAGRSTWNCPRDIILYQQKGCRMIVPFGCLKMLWQSGVTVTPVSHLRASKRLFHGSVNNLYDYQEEALCYALEARNGVLVAPCGSGKTQIGLAICAELGLNTLWLTHTHELLKQSMDRAKQCISSDSEIAMGTITGGKINAVNGITFATVQTMAKIDLSIYKDFWDTIIVDECHKCVGTPTQMTMFWKVLSSLSARHKFGLTATPKRNDGMEKAMFALLGDKFFEITKDQVKSKTVPVAVIEPIETHWEPDFEKALNPDGTLNYVSLITDCVENEKRNNVIAKAINTAASSGPTLVLSDRVAHLEKLSEMCEYSKGNLSSSRKGERKDLLKAIQSGDIKVLFATYAIAKEGLDIPCLEHLVIASPIKDEIAVTQSAGRVMRAYQGKDVGYIWEFEDDMPMLQKWLNKRLSIYRRLNK